MGDEVVKVIVQQESQGTALKDAQRDAEKLREEAARLRQSAEVYSSKYGFDDSRARSARSEAAAREREASRLERPINTEQKAVQKEERDEKARAIRAHRAAQRAAAAEERADIRDVAREHRHAETQRQRFGRGAVRLGTAAAEGGNPAYALSSMLQGAGGVAAGLAGIGAIAAFKIVDEVIADRIARQGIALRDASARTLNARGLSIGAGWRGTSGQSQSEEFATQQRMAEREANRPELERQGRRAWYNPMRMFGSQTWEGQRNLDEDTAAQRRDAELREKQREQTRKKFREEEGGIETDIARHRAERTMSGSRAAFIDEQKKQWLARYRSMRGAGATDEQASQTAGLEAETRMRERQIGGGSGLVTAHSGAGDIAAAARWAGMSTPGMDEMKHAIDSLHHTVRNNSERMEEQHGRKEHSIEAQDRRK